MKTLFIYYGLHRIHQDVLVFATQLAEKYEQVDIRQLSPAQAERERHYLSDIVTS